MIKKLLILTFCFSCIKCIEPYEFKTEEVGNPLVVEGEISTVLKDYNVKLSRASNYKTDINQFESFDPVDNAEVYIHNITKNTFAKLKGTGSGIYAIVDPQFVGEVGNKYFLEIITDNKTYHSTTEEIKDVPPIDSIYYEYQEDSNLIDVYINFKDFNQKGTLLQWEWSGFYQIITFLPSDPDTFTCCSRCYFPVQGSDISLFKDTFQNGQLITQKRFAQIPVDRPTDFLISVEQKSLNEEAFTFYELLKTQRESSGGLFDPPPYEIVGNISNINDENETVLGFFKSTATNVGIIKVRRSDFYKPSPNEQSIVADCRTLPRADTVQPLNW